jgi:hypothetical protein
MDALQRQFAHSRIFRQARRFFFHSIIGEVGQSQSLLVNGECGKCKGKQAAGAKGLETKTQYKAMPR